MCYSFEFTELITISNVHGTLQAMVSHGRVELLAHPLSQKYLQMKWNSYGKYFHLANLLIYSVFLLFVTIFSSELMQKKAPPLNNTELEVY